MLVKYFKNSKASQIQTKVYYQEISTDQHINYV